MSVIDQSRGGTSGNLIIQQKYIERVLIEEAANIFAAQDRVMAKYGTSAKDMIVKSRSFQVQGTTGTITHAMVARFIDMKYIRGQRKLAIPVHNRIIYGHLNNIINKIAFGLTNDIKELIAQEYNIEL